MSIHRLLVGLLIASVSMVAGCPDSDSASSGTEGSATAASGGANAASPSVGAVKPLTKSSQLIGAWYITQENQDFIGMEFGKDGKAMVYMPFGEAETWEYEVLEDGRLRMILGGVATMFFRCKVDQESLLLEAESPDMVQALAFRRLHNQSVTEAHKAWQAGAAERAAARLDELRKLLGGPNLVIASHDPTVKAPRVALKLQPQGDAWQGAAHFDAPPSVRNAAARLEQDQTTIPPQPVVVVQLADVIGSGGPMPVQHETVRFAVQGTGDKLALTSGALSLKADPPMHAAIVKSYDDMIASVMKAIDPLGTLSIAEVALPHPAGPDYPPIIIRVGLLRAESKPAFMTANLANRPNPLPQEFHQPAIVEVRGNRPFIIGAGVQLEPINVDGKMLLRGQYMGREVQLPVVRTLSKEQVIRQREAVAQFLDNTLASGVMLRGRVLIDGKPDMPVPITLALKSDGQRNLSGVASVCQLDGRYNMQGNAAPTLTGAVIELKNTGLIGEPRSTLLGTGYSLTLDLDMLDGTPRIQGGVGGGYEVGPVMMTLATPQAMNADRQKLQSLLAGGMEFVCTDPSFPAAEPVRFKLKLDGGRISGEATDGFNHAVKGPGKLTGEVKEQEGMIVLMLDQEPGTNARGQPIVAAKHMLWVVNEGDQTMLTGWTLPSNINPPTVTPAKFKLAR